MVRKTKTGLRPKPLTHASPDGLYRDLVLNSPIAAYRTNLQGDFLFVNESMVKLLEYDSSGALMKVKVVSLYKNPQDRSSMLAQLKSRDRLNNYEIELVTKRGKTITILLNATLGKEILSGTIIDITKHKQVEDALRRSEDKFRALIENTPDTVMMIDCRGTLQFINKTVPGFTMEQVLGTSIYDYILPEYQALTKKAIAQVFQTGQPQSLELRGYGPEKSIVWYEAVIGPIKQDGKIIAVVKIARDITERKQLETIAKKQTQMLAEHVKELQCRDTVTKIISESHGLAEQCCNQIVSALPAGWQYPEITCARITIKDKQYQTDNFKATPWRLSAVINLFNKPQGTIEIYYLEEPPPGDNGPFLKEEQTLLEDINHKISIVLERDWHEKEKNKIQAQLAQVQKMETIGTLAGGVAHDFNNLLTVIQGYTDLMLMDTEQTHPNYDNLQHITQAATRAADLTRQLLLFARQHPLETIPLNLNATVNNLLKMLQRLLGEDIIIKTELASDIRTIEGDKSTLEQVIMNLVINARDAMPQGGEITIKTENTTIDEAYCQTHAGAKAGQFAQISISDTGTGMDQATMKRLFEPFFTTKGAGKGSGLGLSVVFGIIKQHNGWINAYSEPACAESALSAGRPGHGTVFKIYLPAVPVKPQASVAKDISARELLGQGERILLLEDEKAVRVLARSILEKNGYQVLAASTVKEAREIFDREKGNFKLIFSDVVLPDATGLDFVANLPENLPILMSSGYASAKARRQILKEKKYPFIQKPYNIQKLLKMVRGLIEIKK